MAGEMLFKKDVKSAQIHEQFVAGLFSSDEFARLAERDETKDYDGGVTVVHRSVALGDVFAIVPSDEAARAVKWFDDCQENPNPVQRQRDYQAIVSSTTRTSVQNESFFDMEAALKHRVHVGGCDLRDLGQYAVGRSLGFIGDGEVKADMASAKYGRLYFEKTQNPKNRGQWWNSGLSITTADAWVHLGGEPMRPRIMFVLRTADLRDYITRTEPDVRPTYSDNNTTGWVVPAWMLAV